MKSDPFAPADSPLHAKNIRRLAADGQFVGQHADRFEELVQVHVTGHEGDADQVPALEELERRQTLVDEFREQLATEGPDAELPTLEDVTGRLYRWHEGDRPDGGDGDPDGQSDGTTSSGWRFAGEPQEGDPAGGLEIPPRNGPGSDTDTWRAFAAQATLTEPAQWATLTRTDIISTLERDGVIPSEQA